MTRALILTGLAALLLIGEAVIGSFWVFCVLVVWGSVAAGAGATLRFLRPDQISGPSGPEA